jgi:hypothetical protein
MLSHTAWFLLETAKTRAEGSALNLQAAAVFYAFTFEAYLNHVGAEEIEIWEEIERIPHSRKLKAISKHLGLRIDTSRPPFSSISELFSLRDLLAHGRNRTINEEYDSDEEPDATSSWKIHPWEKLTVDILDEYAGNVRKAVEIINAHRPQPESEIHLWNQGIRGRLVQTKKDVRRTSR